MSHFRTQKLKQLTEARQNSEALQYGSQHELHCGKDIYAFSRIRPEEEVVCLFNTGDEPQTVTVPPKGYKYLRWR